MTEIKAMSSLLTKFDNWRTLKLTWKTKIFLFLYRFFSKASQWFIKHCDYEE